jgi:hypothetical protein
MVIARMTLYYILGGKLERSIIRCLEIAVLDYRPISILESFATTHFRVTSHRP